MKEGKVTQMFIFFFKVSIDYNFLLDSNDHLCYLSMNINKLLVLEFNQSEFESPIATYYLGELEYGRMDIRFFCPGVTKNNLSK